MGAGISSQHAYLDTSWSMQVGGEWRAEMAKELDRLGGADRRAIKRGKSMALRLELLQEKLVEQENAIETALAKDPLAGRHEIIKQEQYKAVRSGLMPPPSRHHFSVREWQQMRHTELRALERQELSTSRNSNGGGGEERPAWDPLHWTGRKAAGTDGGPGAEDIRLRMRDYYLNMDVNKKKAADRRGERQRQIQSIYQSTNTRQESKYSQWRLNVFKAKKTAFQAVGTLVKMQTEGAMKRRRPALQRMDSFSFYISNHLGADLNRFVEEHHKYQASLAVVKHARQGLEDLHKLAAVAQGQEPSGDSESTDAAGQLSRKSAPPAAAAAAAAGTPLQPAPPPSAPSGSSPLFRTSAPAAAAGPPKHPHPPPSAPAGSSPLSGTSRAAGAAGSPSFRSVRSSPSTPPSARATRLRQQAAAASGSPAPPGGSPASSPGVRSAWGTTDGSPSSLPVLPGTPTQRQRPHSDQRPQSQGRPYAQQASMRLRGSVQGSPASPLSGHKSQSILNGPLGGSPSGGGAVARSIVSKDLVLGLEADVAREQSLIRCLTEETAAMERPQRMMTMYINRCNAAWCEGMTWDAPPVYHTARFAQEAGGAQPTVYRQAVVDMLRQGKIGVQVFVGDEYLRVSEAALPVSLWSVDPWKVINQLLPAKCEGVSQLSDVPLGPRLLMALVTAVEAVAGEAAARALRIIIHCNEEQEGAVVRELKDRKHLGLPPDHIMLVTQHRRGGYTHDHEQGRFVRRPGSGLRQAGSGYCMMQLNWPGEAFTVDAEGNHTFIEEPLLDHLASVGVDWLMTRRLRDLSLYDPTSTLDVESMAYGLHLHEAQGANAVVHVDLVSSVQGAGSISGFVMGHRQHDSPITPSPPTAPAAGGRSRPVSRALPGNARQQQIRSSAGGASAAAVAHGGPLPVVEVKITDLQAPKMTSLLHDVKQKTPSHQMAVSTRRYTWHVQTLRAVLTTPAVFHPSVEVAGDVAYVIFDAADLTSAPAVHCVALHNAKAPAKNIASAADVDELMTVISAQDNSATFRRLLGSTQPPRSDSVKKPLPEAAKAQAAVELLARKSKSVLGQRIVFFISDNPATKEAMQLSLSLFKPGRDLVMLVTVVPDALSTAGGMEVLRKYEEAVRVTLVDTVCEVLVKDGVLIDQLSDYVESSRADLVIMGSQALGAAANNAAVMGSVALSVLKSITRPLLIVKANARNTAIAWDKDKLKCMAAVDHASRPMLKYVCSKLLNAGRYDKLYLGRGQGMDRSMQETVTSRRLLENFSDIASSHHYNAIKRPLEGPFEESGCKAADTEKIHIMAVQAPSTRGIPEPVIKLLKTSRSAVLVYKSNEAF